MTLEGAQNRIWYSKIGWQTVPCSWSIDGEAALTGSSPVARDQQSPRRRGTQLLATMCARSGPAHTGQPDSEGLHRVDTSTQAPPSCR